MTEQIPPTPLPTVNPDGQAVVTAVEAALKQGEAAAETAIIAAEPWMATPVWKQLWEKLLDLLVQYLGQPLVMYSGRIMVDLDEYVALKKAVSAQAALDAAKKKGDPHEISQASSSVDSAVAGVIHYIGASK